MDSSCPARGQNCNEYGGKGHFSPYCKAKEKRPAKGTKKDNVNRVSGKTVSPRERTDYTFVVRHKHGGEGEVSLKVGGMRVEGVLIDSGASCNLKNVELFEAKQRGIPISSICEKDICIWTKRTN